MASILTVFMKINDVSQRNAKPRKRPLAMINDLIPFPLSLPMVVQDIDKSIEQ